MHPRIKLPLWAAAVLPVAAYLIRSVFRGFDFVPDLPLDAIAFATLGLLTLVVSLARRADSANKPNGNLSDEVKDKNTSANSER